MGLLVRGERYRIDRHYESIMTPIDLSAPLAPPVCPTGGPGAHLSAPGCLLWGVGESS